MVFDREQSETSFKLTIAREHRPGTAAARTLCTTKYVRPSPRDQIARFPAGCTKRAKVTRGQPLNNLCENLGRKVA